MNNYSTSETNKQFIPVPVTGGAEPERLPCCEICGRGPAELVNVLDYGPLHLCKTCKGLFGFEAGGENE